MAKQSQIFYKRMYLCVYITLKVQDLESGNEKITDSQLHDEIMTMFLAGHETTSNALTWTFYLLSKHPAIESRLFEEIYRTD